MTKALFNGAVSLAALILIGAVPAEAEAAVASGPSFLQSVPLRSVAGNVIAVNDDDVFNPSDGDIFTQNAQDQSTAEGAGT
ncbi:hypothetical protein [Mycobacterium sp.]|uniref:hypothetical protein n=1 Tax=Mycobacterium sp. TaxID=1785 RepID=UPI0025D853B5|nr:hypothetical protein [Mycobacterium sp.]MBW0012836.1 hypothetical protein [Mycobacterium sp.]